MELIGQYVSYAIPRSLQPRKQFRRKRSIKARGYFENRDQLTNLGSVIPHREHTGFIVRDNPAFSRPRADSGNPRTAYNGVQYGRPGITFLKFSI